MDYKYYYSNDNGQDDYGLKMVSDNGMGLKCNQFKLEFPYQEQAVQPGLEYMMEPRPIFDDINYIGSSKLQDKVAIITGGDSGLGRAVAVRYVKEGAKVVIPYLDEYEDAAELKKYLDSLGGESLFLAGDIKDKKFCEKIIEETLNKFEKIDILINNAAVQYQQKSLI